MSYRCNCGQEFEAHQERTMHMVEMSDGKLVRLSDVMSLLIPPKVDEGFPQADFDDWFKCASSNARNDPSILPAYLTPTQIAQWGYRYAMNQLRKGPR